MAHPSFQKLKKPSESWRISLALIIGGWLLFVAVNVFIEQQFGHRNSPISTSIQVLSFMFIAMLSVALLISFLVGKGVKKYRAIPNVALVLKAFWVSCAFLFLLTLGSFKTTRQTNSYPSQQIREFDPIEAFNQMAEVNAFVTRLSLEEYGEVESNFDHQAMKAIEQWLVDTSVAKLEMQYAELGVEVDDIRELVSITSSVMNIDDQDLAFFKMNIDDAVRMVAIFGVEEDNWVKVTCVRNSNHDVTVFSGPCGHKISEAFGVQIEQ